MEIIDLARKFSADPSSCTADEVATLAQQFNLAHPHASALLEVGNSYPTKWDGLTTAIAKAHYERSNLEALSINPFAEHGALPQVPGDNPLAELSQGELAKLAFKA